MSLEGRDCKKAGYSKWSNNNCFKRNRRQWWCEAQPASFWYNNYEHYKSNLGCTNLENSLTQGAVGVYIKR